MCLIEMGMPEDGTGSQAGASARTANPRSTGCRVRKFAARQDVSEGIGVRTDSPLVEECRRGVMEFLLINHPLDCPICDQAGECRLQEFSVEYGSAGFAFSREQGEEAEERASSARASRSMTSAAFSARAAFVSAKEIAHDDVLGFIDRGSYTILTAHPGRPLDNNYSLNTVDICPVGALTSTDFRFKMRVWFLKETKSICTSCATGCNTIIGTREDVIYRQTPRENDRG